MTAASLLAAAALAVWDCPSDPSAADGLPEPVPAHAETGGAVVVGAANTGWNRDAGCFDVRLELEGEASGANAGDLYVNRDQGHSSLKASDFPGLTRVSFDAEARARGVDVDFPNALFGHPVFGNCSRAMTTGPVWRSLPRALLTFESGRLALMHRLYLSNQIWVFPAVNDTPPLGKFGDVFASAAPYWIVTEGKSWSDQYYLRAALEASRSFRPEVKRELVARGLLAPTIQALLRRSLNSVRTDADYMTYRAHPTAFPPKGLDLARLKESARAMTVESIPPVAVITGLAASKTEYSGALPEVTYVTPCAVGIVLRGPEERRSFLVRVAGGDGLAFASVHGDDDAVEIRRAAPDAAEIIVDRTRISSTNRLDIAVFTKSATSDWGAPSFVSFAVLDPAAKYTDPVLAGTAPGWRRMGGGGDAPEKPEGKKEQ